MLWFTLLCTLYEYTIDYITFDTEIRKIIKKSYGS